MIQYLEPTGEQKNASWRGWWACTMAFGIAWWNSQIGSEGEAKSWSSCSGGGELPSTGWLCVDGHSQMRTRGWWLVVMVCRSSFLPSLYLTLSVLVVFSLVVSFLVFLARRLKYTYHHHQYFVLNTFCLAHQAPMKAPNVKVWGTLHR